MTTHETKTLTPTGDPSPIDWLDLRRAPGLADASGRLGMTSLAGAGGLRRDDGVDMLVLLVADRELAAAGVPGIVETLGGEGIRVVRHSVVDMGVPEDLAAFRAVLDAVRAEVRNGRSVVVACLGGYGRTGTAVACLLADAGLGGDEAIALVRASRPGTIERGTQEAFVRGWPEG